MSREIFPRRAGGRRGFADIQPLRSWRRSVFPFPELPGRLSPPGRSVSLLPVPLVRMRSSERPGAVRATPTGAAKRTLDGEDRSATIAQEEEEIVALSVPETQ